ncbi:MAG TPA: HD domain-containing phosphohydrolase [Phycisphaerae bacterium]|nr:HD domain-containing phosphohydrolase [Phycisphaerae bacterium]
MQIFDVANLAPGKQFPEPLFHATGRKLLSANTQLTQLHIDALTRSGIRQVYMAPNARAVLDFGGSQNPAAMVPIASLSLGQTADTDLLTPDGIVIIQQNDQVEDHHLAALRDSGIEYLMARPAADLDSIRATLQDLSRVLVGQMEALIKRGEYIRAPEARDPFIESIHAPPPADTLNLSSIQLLRRRLSARLQPIYGMLETGKQPAFPVLVEICEDLVDLMRAEPRQFAQLALMTARREDYLPDHAVSVAVLAMAIAAHMKLSLDLIKEVTFGALVFDVGMLALPKRIRNGSGVLSDGDKQRVRLHPSLSLSMMEQLPGLSPIARIMGFQHHERLKGNGYPNSAVGENISDYARIVAAADVFAASINPRAYKSPKLPYTAMEELIRMAHHGMVDSRVVKALLAAVGLFPVGSYIVLSNNVQAQVVGANPARIDRPLIRPLAGDPCSEPAIVDLSEPHYAHLKVTRAIPTPLTLEPAPA